MSNVAYSRELGRLIPQDLKECHTLVIEECGHGNMASVPVNTGS
jgi:hypothetical protein